MGVAGDPIIRQPLAASYTHERIEQLPQPARWPISSRRFHRRARRVARQAAVDQRDDAVLRTSCRRSSAPALIADTGAWGTYGWAEHVLGAPGYRIAGGSDEIQRNIIGERVLGLPPEPRVDKDVPWRDVRR